MFTDPAKNVAEFGFIPGQKVADFGSGSGHYSTALSKFLGPSGCVYAIDLNKDMLVKLKNEAFKDGRGNIEIIWGDVEKPNGTKLKDVLVDGVVLSNTLFQFQDVTGAVNEAKRILKAGGRVGLVEWRGKGPIQEAEAKNLFASSGLTFERSFDAGESHYGLIFKKPLQ